LRRRSRGDGEAVDRGRGDTTVFRAGVGVGVGRGATYSPIVGSMGTDGAGDDFTAAVCGSGAGGASRRTPATTLIAAITATTTPATDEEGPARPPRPGILRLWSTTMPSRHGTEAYRYPPIRPSGDG